MSKIEIGAFVTVTVAVISLAFWCGTLQGRVNALERADPIPQIPELERQVADLAQQVKNLEEGSLVADHLTLSSLAITRSGLTTLSFQSDDRGGRIIVFDAGGQERGEIRVETGGDGVSYRSKAVDDTTRYWNAKEALLP